MIELVWTHKQNAENHYSEMNTQVETIPRKTSWKTQV